MRKRNLLTAVILAACMALAACGSKVAVTGLTLSEKQIMVAVGESVSLTATVTPDDASNKNVLWQSSDESVATVKNGSVKGVKAGTAKVTAATEDGNFKAECQVIVTPDYEIEATLADWENDRTEPQSWEIANGWITFATKTEPKNDWYSWHGKKAATDMKATDAWMVSTKLDLTAELAARDGVRTSMWLNVMDGNGQSVDWAILQYVRNDAEKIKGWQYWNSADEGAWVNVENLEAAEGVHELAIAFDSGRISLYIDAVKAAEYVVPSVTKVGEVIFNSYSYGESYEAKWMSPKVEYDAAYQDGDLFAGDEAQLRDALGRIEDGGRLVLTAGSYVLSSQVYVDKDITIEGAGDVVLTKGATDWTNSTGSKGLASIVMVYEANVTLRNLTITGAETIDMTSPSGESSGKDYGHGLNAVKSTVTLENVTLSDNAACGIVANSSTVTLKNVQTAGNGWAGVNADSAADAEAATVVNVDADTRFGEAVQIYSDKTVNVSIMGDGYTSKEENGKTVWTKA